MVLERVFKKDVHSRWPQNQFADRATTRYPSEVGADRIVNARAAVELLKGPAIVLDFGTATTFDCVTARHEYIGGVIAPGPVHFRPRRYILEQRSYRWFCSRNRRNRWAATRVNPYKPVFIMDIAVWSKKSFCS